MENLTGKRRTRFAEILATTTQEQVPAAYEKLLRQEQTYQRRLQRAREERAFLREQAAAFERQVRLAEERARRQEMQRQAEARMRAQVEAVRLARERRNAAARERRRLARVAREQREAAEVAAFRNTIVYDKTISGAQYAIEKKGDLYYACRDMVGNSAYIQITRYGAVTETIADGVVSFEGVKPTDRYYDRVNHLFWRAIDSSGLPIFHPMTPDEEKMTIRARVIISSAHDAPPLRIKQQFRDGNQTHCVIDPLVAMYQGYLAATENKNTQKNIRSVINGLTKLREKWENGVPESEMETVARVARRCIIMYDVLGNETQRWNTRSSVKFYFTNTRENHVDVGHITLDKTYERVTQEDLNRILMEHDRDQVFYLFKGEMARGVPQSLRSARGAWAVFNPEYDAFQRFNETVGIKNYRLDALRYPIVNSFVRDGSIVHSGVVPLCAEPNRMDAKHMDIVKAYTQHECAVGYAGFLGHIQQWARLEGHGLEFVRSHLGIYRFEVTELHPTLRKLGMRVGLEYTLPGPELLYLCDVWGMTVTLVAGCWGSRMDIEYSEEMLSDRRYCVWAGKLMSEKPQDFYMFRGSYEWGCHLKAELGESRVFVYNGFIVVKNDRKSVMTTHHIGAFITSYSRINMLEMMRAVRGTLVKVVLDGLYFVGEMDAVNVPCVAKKLKQHKGFADGWYHTASADVSGWPMYSPDLDGSCVLAGAGGTGKSWRVFNDAGIVKPLYVVPSHVLGQKFRETFDCSYTTIHKLIGVEGADGKKCRPWRDEYSSPATIFIDEITMIPAEWIERAIKMYPNSRLYIAGDIDGKQWYQCRSGGMGNYAEVWNPSRSEWRFLDFTHDYRSQDETLRQFKLDVRELMRRVFTDGGVEDAARINDVVRDKFPCVSFDEACKMFRTGDVWIAGTHKTDKKLLDHGVVSGWMTPRKEISYVECDGVKRGAFTCHSFQGLTIEDKRVFVSLDTFEYAMFYTAISRVRRMSQLVIVK